MGLWISFDLLIKALSHLQGFFFMNHSKKSSFLFTRFHLVFSAFKNVLIKNTITFVFVSYQELGTYYISINYLINIHACIYLEGYRPK